MSKSFPSDSRERGGSGERRRRWCGRLSGWTVGQGHRRSSNDFVPVSDKSSMVVIAMYMNNTLAYCQTISSITHNSNNPPIRQQVPQPLQKVRRKERNRLRSARKYVMDDVVVPCRPVRHRLVGKVKRVPDDCRVVGGQAKVLCRVGVHDRVDFDNGGVDAVLDEGARGGADAEASVSNTSAPV